MKTTATEFAETHPADADWVAAMGDQEITHWKQGDRVEYSGFPGTIVRHYHNGMFEVRVPGGVTCCGHHEITAIPPSSHDLSEPALFWPATPPAIGPVDVTHESGPGGTFNFTRPIRCF